MHFTLIIFVVLQSCCCIAQRLRIVTIENEPFYTQTAGGAHQGFLADLLENLIQRANIGTDDTVRYSLYTVRDGKYGMRDANGQWNGMVGDLLNGDADMIAAPLTVTKDRSEVILFSHPFMTTVIVPVVKKPVAGQPMPFEDLEDLATKAESRQLTVGYIQHGSTETFLGRHKMPAVRRMHNASKAAEAQNPYVSSYAEGLGRVRNGHNRFVFYGEHVTFEHMIQRQPCDLMLAWQGAAGARYYALGFAKSPSGRQWADRFDRVLLEAEEDGTVAMLKQRWWAGRNECDRTPMCACQDQ